MFTFILAETELELMPAALQKDPHVVARAKKRRRAVEHLLLDQAFDHEAMRNLDDGDRRGRPDIAHFVMMLLLDSMLGKQNALRILVHTRHDELIRVRPDLRIMRNQTKFTVLAEDLLRQGEVPRGSPLLTFHKDYPLERVLREEAKGTKVLLDVGGQRARTAEFHDIAKSDTDVTTIVGGFPRGAFRQAKPEMVDRVLRVADTELTVWSALVPVIAGYEDSL